MPSVKKHENKNAPQTHLGDLFKLPFNLPMRQSRTLLASSFFLSFLLFAHCCSASLTLNPSLVKRTKTMADSSVIGELKDTVKKQAEEIKLLKLKLKGEKSGAPAGHGGHGGGGDVSSDELRAYLTKPFYMVAFQRVGWLSIFLVSLSFTALIMNQFEHTLERQIELAYFTPLLAGHGGNTGGQAVGTVLSAFSGGYITLKDAPRIVGKEALSGLMAGVILGGLAGPVVHFTMGISLHVSAVIACTLPLVSAIASSLGAMLPFACIAMGLDASVIAAPAMTSLVDVSGLMAYFVIANHVFALFGIEM